jgi:hypothetical protein
MPDTQNAIDEFVESLIEAKNYKTLTLEMREELKKDVIDRVQDFIIAKTIAKLSDQQAKDFGVLLDTDPDDKTIQEFIAKAIPDAPAFIGDTLFAFRQTYLGLV